LQSEAWLKTKRLRAQYQCTPSQRTAQWQIGNLPAVAAVSTVAAAISAAPATAATSAAISATASASTTAAIASAPTTATAAGALGLRTRFIDYQVPATEILTVEIGDRAIRFFIIRNFDEGKTPRLAREPIPN
jgi:hypothetical protein